MSLFKRGETPISIKAEIDKLDKQAAGEGSPDQDREAFLQEKIEYGEDGKAIIPKGVEMRRYEENSDGVGGIQYFGLEDLKQEKDKATSFARFEEYGELKVRFKNQELTAGQLNELGIKARDLCIHWLAIHELENAMKFIQQTIRHSISGIKNYRFAKGNSVRIYDTSENDDALINDMDNLWAKYGISITKVRESLKKEEQLFHDLFLSLYQQGVTDIIYPGAKFFDLAKDVESKWLEKFMKRNEKDAD